MFSESKNNLTALFEIGLTFGLWYEDWVASALLAEAVGFGHSSAFGGTHGRSVGHVGVRAALEVVLAGEVRLLGLGGGS